MALARDGTVLVAWVDQLPGYASAGYPTLAVAAGDTLVVQFELQRDARQRPTALGMVLSGDAGASFTAPAGAAGCRR